MPRKRILLLIKGLGRGGAEQLLASAASYHDRDRFEYEVAYRLPWKDALVAELQKADLPVQCLAGARGAGWVRRIRRLIDQRAIGLIHSHSPVVAVAAKVIAPARVRRVYTEHNVWERYHPLTRWANALTFARSDHVFAVSDHVRDSIPGSESGLPDAVPYWDWGDAETRRPERSGNRSGVTSRTRSTVSRSCSRRPSETGSSRTCRSARSCPAVRTPRPWSP
jgi:hypothetical protein